MSVLAFDTCFAAASVAVRWQRARGEWLIREAYEEGEAAGAERLAAMIAEAMEGAGLSFRQIDRIAVTVGPGTFTGVRTGIATARALALANDTETVALPSLTVMAHRAELLLGGKRGGKRMAVIVDARRGGFYVQIFGESAGDPVGVPELLTADSALDRLGGGPVLVVGSGGPRLADAARGRGLELDVQLDKLLPHARALVLLAPNLAPVAPLRPLYLRTPDVRPQADKTLPRVP
jgi:tRNA threonylcarbamoyladenosine biosynthesis protein TsaB